MKNLTDQQKIDLLIILKEIILQSEKSSSFGGNINDIAQQKLIQLLDNL